MNKVLILTALFLIGTVSCTKVIDLELKESDSQIVLKGEVNSGELIHSLSITKSIAFNQDNVFPGLTGATVTLTDNQGNSETLVDLGDGNYKTVNFLAAAGRTYTFNVVAEGETFVSSSTIPALVPLLGIDFIPSSFFGSTGNIIVPKFLDPAGIKNSYIFYYYNADSLDQNSGYIFANDNFADGQLNQQPFFGNWSPESGDSVIYEMYGIDTPVFVYYFSFEQNTSGNSGAPANPVSNWSNNALGYFTAQNFQSFSALVP
ncbi:DUF4249 domain-containing protein [Crocinitomicaceae bacterium]|jgi:hypothetical protein|nr:DUF4249 domain-containing protein [Crocinitomicaceae bacterium]MDG2464354.1 hypothetical protein [Crocinitomicaceae bacterium]